MAGGGTDGLIGVQTVKQEQAKARDNYKPKPAKTLETEPGPQPQVRLKDQEFLLQHYHELNLDITEKRKGDDFKIKNFAMIHGKLDEVINMIAPKKIRPFLDLTPAQKAILQPYIRFYKVYKQGQKTKKSEEFTFRIHSAARQKIDGITAIDAITATGLGRIPDIGLKSVTFKESGGYEQAHTPATIIAKIELYCNTLDSVLLNYKEKGPDGTVEYPFGRTEQEPPPPPILDLISYSDKFADDGNKKEFGCFDQIFDTLRSVNKIEIHAHVGWSVPNNAGNLRDFRTPEDFKNFKNAIESSRAVLILNLLKSELDFQDDGSIKIVGEYQARVESVMNDPSLGVLSQTSKSNEALGALIRDYQTQPVVSSFFTNPDNIYYISENSKLKILGGASVGVIHELCEKIKLNPDSPESTKEKQKLQAYILFLKKISGAVFASTDARVRIDEQMRLIDQLVKDGKIFHLDADDKAFGFSGAVQTGILSALKGINPGKSGEQLLEIARKQHPTFFSKVVIKPQVISFSGNQAEARRKELSDGLKAAHETADKDEIKATQKKILTKYEEGNKSATPPGMRRISWFYLGDMFDLILGRFYKESGIDDIRFILGPMGSPVSNQTFSLANLPISLELFVKWWTKHVVIPGKETYSLKAFIKDILGQLIAPATGAGLESSDGSKITPQGSYIIFHAPKDFKFENGVIHSVDKMNKLVKAIRASTIRPDPADLVTYVYIYALDPTFNKRTANQEEDEEAGIYHLTYGRDRGIVRRIKFKRVETRGRREALLEQHDGLNNLAQHSERYNASIFMEGNGVFKPGMQVYINPYTSTISKRVSPVKLTNALGLGGYYWISSIETTFEGNSSYETIAECIWTSPGTYSPAGVKNEGTKSPDISANPNGK